MADWNLFGLTVADLAYLTQTVDGVPDVMSLAADVLVTFHSAETGGTQYEDLAADIGGDTQVSFTTTAASGDARPTGVILPVYAPPDRFLMWAQAGSGPRLMVISSAVASRIAPQVAGLAAAYAEHVAGVGHTIRLDDLADVAASAPSNGQIPVYDDETGAWIATDPAGAAGAVTLTGDQTVSGAKVHATGNANKTAIRMDAASGQAANLLEAYSSALAGQGGTAQLGVAVGPAGELRVGAVKADSVPARIKGQTSQTANLLELLSSADALLAWIAANGSVRAPNLGQCFTWAAPEGDVATSVGRHKVRNMTGVPLTIRSVCAQVNTAPTGSAIQLDVFLDGVSIFSGTKPSIAAAATASSIVTPTTTTWPAGSHLTMSVLSVGSTTPGQDLTAQVLAY